MYYVQSLLLSPLSVIVGIVLLVVAITYWATESENRDIADFTQRCEATGDTPQKCAIMAEVKRDADDGQFMAGAAIGYSAGRGH